MKAYSIADIKNRFDALGLKWHNFHVVGIRAKEHKSDAFQDSIILIWGNVVKVYTGTTIPGVHWLQNLLNPNGTAVLVADRQYEDCFKIGLHKGEQALIQVKPLLVHRDKNKNSVAETNTAPVVAGPECRIDIHGANKNVVSVLIGKWSAGCQVLNNPVQFNELIDSCKRAGLGNFTYTLLNEF